MRNINIWILVLIMAAACAPIKRHSRLVNKFPYVHTQDTIIVRDTISILVPKTEIDTIFSIERLRDTITIEKDRLKIKLYQVRDSIYINGECDTIRIEKIIERKIPIRYYEDTKWHKWLWIILAIAGLFVLIRILTRFKSGSDENN